MKIYTVTTGEIVTAEFTKGPLEFLSIGNYGQSANIKADFIGITEPIRGVPNGEVIPLSEKWMVKITPIHVNTATTDNGIKSTDAYDLYDFYAPHEESFKKAGFDTLVFVPSYDEDYGMITCGNAILSGRTPTIPYEFVDTANT